MPATHVKIEEENGSMQYITQKWTKDFYVMVINVYTG